MKLLLLLIAVGVLFWMLRSSVRGAMKPPARDCGNDRAGPLPAKAMLVCAQCGVHVPRDDALPGRGGFFCDAGHRAVFEAAHPDAPLGTHADE